MRELERHELRRTIERELDRLAGLIGAPRADIVGFDPYIDLGCPFIQIDDAGLLHWVVKERGQEWEHRIARDLDELLYWSFEVTTGEMASRWVLSGSRPAGEDQRAGRWWKQAELLRKLSPEWVVRWRAELADRIPNSAAHLLPEVEGA